MTTPRTTHQNQEGIVAIMITLLMMVLVTTIILSFSAIVRREQRQTVDRQLNTRADYAAESVVNTVNKAIDNAIDNNLSLATITKATCAAPTPAGLVAYAGSFPSAPDLSVPCYTIDPFSYDLTYSSIAHDTSQIGHLKTAAPADQIDQVEFAWDSFAGSSSFGAGSSFPAAAAWGTTPPVLRVDLVPIQGAQDMTKMYDNAEVYFLYPDGGAADSPVSGGGRGVIINGHCNNGNNPRVCRATVNVAANKEFYIRIRPIYGDAKVVVTPKQGGAAVQLTEGQITIDATGLSGGVLKRISVRRPVVASSITPGFAIDSNTGICKKISASPVTPTSPTGTTDTCP